MWETNVLGTLRMTRALLPALREPPATATSSNIGSIAGFETYAGGAGYTGAKHAARAFTRTLRLELLGQPVRVTEIAPGLVETEFALVRFAGDAERAQRGLPGHAARWPPRTSPTASSGRRPARRMSTSTRSWSGRATRPPRPRSTAAR